MTSPMALMVTMFVDSAIESHGKILELVNDYEKRGIDVIPISELKTVIAEGTKKAVSDDGLMAKMLEVCTKGAHNKEDDSKSDS